MEFDLTDGCYSFHSHYRSEEKSSGDHPDSYPMDTRGSFPGVKQTGREANHSPPSGAEVKEWLELYLHSPSTPLWRGAQLKHRDNFTFTLQVRRVQRSMLALYIYNLSLATNR
jgi:hypothetical protein